MSFVLNNTDMKQQSMFDSHNFLTDREKRFLDKSWAGPFADIIFPAIDEKPFAVLYSDRDSRPNTPVNVTIGAMILKELTGSSDEDIFESLLFDVRYQHALGTTHFDEQPMSDRTLGRFRKRCYEHELETGIDLIHDTVTSLSEEMARFMKVDHGLKRMDSLMVSSNIKKMSRLELLYTCVANAVKLLARLEVPVPDGLRHYTESNDRNLIIYHNKSDDTQSKIGTVINDAHEVKDLLGNRADDCSEYLLLVRVLREQTFINEDGAICLKEAGSGMDGGILQNPADPDATYRDKAGRQHRGYTLNILETPGENGSIITDYQYEQNTYSDSQFTKDLIEGIPAQEVKMTIAADGAYGGGENINAATAKNIELITTNLTGRESPDIYADFEFNADGTKVVRCAGGHEPKSCCHNRSNNQCVASFHRWQCESCPHKTACNPKVNKKTCRKTVSVTGHNRAVIQRGRDSVEFREISAFRNGVEAIPSLLRRKYNIDRIPVRGKIRSGLFIGFKIAALNFKKLCQSTLLDECAQNPANA